MLSLLTWQEILTEAGDCFSTLPCKLKLPVWHKSLSLSKKKTRQRQNVSFFIFFCSYWSLCNRLWRLPCGENIHCYFPQLVSRHYTLFTSLISQVSPCSVHLVSKRLTDTTKQRLGQNGRKTPNRTYCIWLISLKWFQRKETDDSMCKDKEMCGLLTRKKASRRSGHMFLFFLAGGFTCFYLHYLIAAACNLLLGVEFHCCLGV